MRAPMTRGELSIELGVLVAHMEHVMGLMKTMSADLSATRNHAGVGADLLAIAHGLAISAGMNEHEIADVLRTHGIHDGGVTDD